MDHTTRSAVTDPARLSAVRRTGLLDTGPEESFDRLAQLARSLTGAPRAQITLVDGTRSFSKIDLGAPPDRERSTAVEDSLCRFVVADAAPVAITDALHDPHTRDSPPTRATDPRAYLGHPLRTAEGHVLGAFCVADTEPRTWTERDQEVVSVLAEAASTEIALRVAVAQAQDRSRRMEFLADASGLVSSLPDSDGLPARLARFCVPVVAAVAVLHRVDGEKLRAVGMAHAEPAGQALLEHPAGAVATPDDPASARLFRVLRSDEAELGPLGADDQLGQLLGLSGDHDALVAQAVTAPVRAGGATFGVLTWVAAPGEGYDDLDLALARDLAHRAALAWERAETFAERSGVAVALQRTLLPVRLPAVPGMELAARYVAADTTLDVGGDFYDVFPAADGEWVLVIGDVTGRGVEAAGMTGLARHTLRAVSRSAQPAETLTQLNAVLHEASEDERFITVACARLRPSDARGSLTLASGGHCSPVVVRADGSAHLVEVPGILLGPFPEVDLADVELLLGPGDALVHYTDGVIEARGAHGLFGEERLLEVLRGAPGRSAEELASGVLAAVEDFRTVGADDDLALLVVRRLPLPVPAPVPVLAPSRPAAALELPSPRVRGALTTAGGSVRPSGAGGRGSAVFSAPAVARLTGAGTGDLTAWGARYGLVVPTLTRSLAAAYTSDQVAALRLVRAALLAGADEASAHAALAERLGGPGEGAPGTVPAGSGAGGAGGTGTVLVVDRDRYVVSVLSGALEAAGATPVVAGTTAAAEAAVAGQRVGAAVVEVLLSGESGLALCAWLSERGIPVLMVSSLRAVDEAFTAGAHAFATKPLDPAAIVTAVQDLLTPVGRRDGALA